VGTNSGAIGEVLVLNQEWRKAETRTWLVFQLVPGTASWEEVEARAIDFGLYHVPFRAGHEIWLGDRYRQAVLTLRECLESNPQKLAGVPVFRGTRFSASQFLAELADNEVVQEIADEFEVDPSRLRTFLHAFAVYFDRPTSSR